MFERDSRNRHSRKCRCLRRGVLTLGLFVCAAGSLSNAIPVKADAPEVDAKSEKSSSDDDRDAVGRRQAMDNPIIDIAVSRIGRTGGDYLAHGVWDGIAAFSGATTACNVGTATAEWWWDGFTARHPLIAQNLYRLSADKMRFEMIGMSWLKHSFCAINENTCGNCQFTPCSSLGLGCADTYNASRNGITNLGPRGPVNPVGTQFGGVGPGTHNESFPGPSGNSNTRGRLQVRPEDFQAGAEYFWEVTFWF